VVIEGLGDEAVRVAVCGEMTGPSAYTVDGQLRRVEAAGPSCIVLDLSGLDFIDSSGLGRLLAAHKRAMREHRRLVVVEGSRAVRRLIALSALDHRLELVSDGRAADAVVATVS
jgi:anti-sigma B factor antagonist